jgi:hypothetical protein
LNWITFSIAFVELCERFSYYGTTAVCTHPPFPSTIRSRPLTSAQSSTSFSSLFPWARPLVPSSTGDPMSPVPWVWASRPLPG